GPAVAGAMADAAVNARHPAASRASECRMLSPPDTHIRARGPTEASEKQRRVQCPCADTSSYPRTPRSEFMARACHCKCMTNVHFLQMADLARCLQAAKYTLPQKENPMKTERAL